MPCGRLLEALEELYPLLSPEERGLADRLYSLLARMDPPLLPGRLDGLRVESIEALIRSGRLAEALEESARVAREWRRRRLRGGVLLAAGLLGLVAVSSLNILVLLVGLPCYAALAAWLCNRGAPC